MLLLPPKSTLFPYTTLFRSLKVLQIIFSPWVFAGLLMFVVSTLSHLYRSEEHTSELQSLRHLVCRLLLEKKKINVTCECAAAENDLTTESARTICGTIRQNS